MTRFRILFVFDALVALFVLQQCLQLAPDLGPRHYYDAWPLMLTQLAVLGVFGGALVGALLLKERGRNGLASLVLLIPAVPTLIVLLLLIFVAALFSMGGAHH
ncbi:hypothetical protein [Roseococcus sp. YIM B11640]|uniref:hypothetical protein n=1 Tax=Roseococcus sp. YIM B11640 TaxID=3133973 RepID=UPI003C7BD702